MAKHFGKYRAEVESRIDPMQIGRLLVSVPGLQPEPMWAMPCFPPQSLDGAGWVLPAPGAGVWVEFEEGEILKPIWTGCWYRTASDAPPFVSCAGGDTHGSPAAQPSMEIVLRAAGGALLAIREAGITLSNGKGAVVELAGPTVSINGGALEVT